MVENDYICNMIQLPPSKSIGARFLVATYFAGTLPADPFFEDNEDLMVLQQALLEIYSDEEPIDYGDSPIDVGASGTALRFVTAVCASSKGADYVVTGTDRLMQRPMKPLLDLLKEAGAGIETLGINGKGPYRITGNDLKGGEFSIRGDISSQFISALMLVAPSWLQGMKLNFTTPLVSKPYVEMTARLMERFGVKTELSDTEVIVPHKEYKEPEDFRVEADWSSASFFYEACAMGAEGIEIENLPSPQYSLQGDSVAASIFEKLGVTSDFNKEGAVLTKKGNKEEQVDLSFKDCPDLVLPYAVACLLNDVKFHFDGVANLRVKESDRISSLQKEAEKLGFVVEAGDDYLEWTGNKCEAEQDPVISTYEDHRVAMAFAMVVLKRGEIRIENPEVVAKSFIDFWNQISKLHIETTPENESRIMKLSYIPDK